MMSRKRSSFIVLFAGVGLATSHAATETVPEMTDADPSCACVAQGKRWAQGEEACLSGVRMVCGMEQNVTTWKSLGTSCQISLVKQSFKPFTAM